MKEEKLTGFLEMELLNLKGMGGRGGAGIKEFNDLI